MNHCDHETKQKTYGFIICILWRQAKQTNQTETEIWSSNLNFREFLFLLMAQGKEHFKYWILIFFIRKYYIKHLHPCNLDKFLVYRPIEHLWDRKKYILKDLGKNLYQSDSYILFVVLNGSHKLISGFI